MRGTQEDGTEGVSAMIAGLITGASGAGGFKGLAGRHVRRHLLEFGAPIRGRMRFTRLDTGRAVEADYHPERVPMPPDLKRLMTNATAPGAGDEPRRAFARRWQAWVKTILVDRRDDPLLIEVREAGAAELSRSTL